MTTAKSIKGKIGNINKILKSSIDDKTIFDDCFKDHIIHIENDGYGPPKYKGRGIECPTFQKPFEYDVTKKFSKRSFNSFKKTVNNCILLDALSHIFTFNKFVAEGCNRPDNNYIKLLTTFAHKKDSKSTELFMESVKEHKASISIYVVDVLIFPYLNTNEVRYSIRIGTDFKFENE
jgi:hypothetical protein